MHRSRLQLWLVLIAYLLCGAVKLVHALEQAAPILEHAHAGPSVEASCESDDCTDRGHHHHGSRDHDHSTCASCNTPYDAQPGGAPVGLAPAFELGQLLHAAGDRPERDARPACHARAPPFATTV